MKRTLFLSMIFSILFSLGLSGLSLAEALDGGVISLEKSQQMALQRNPGLKNLNEVVYQAEVQIYQAWSIILPNISANGSITRNSDEAGMDIPIDMSNPALGTETKTFMNYWDYKFGFTANLPLFNARSIPLLKNAYDYLDNSRLDSRHRKNEFLFAVSAAYYNVHGTKESVEVAKDNLENSHEFHRLAEARLKVGQTTRIDVLRAESDLMEAEKKLKNAQDALIMAKASLAYLVGIEGAYNIVEPPSATPVEGDLQQLIRSAMEKRLDLKVSRSNVTMAGRSRADTGVQYIPTFDLTYVWNWNTAGGFAGSKDSWMLIFGAKWSLLEGGMRIATLHRDASDIRMSENQLQQLELDIREEVERNLIELAKTRRNVELAGKQISVAEETHKLVKRQYEVGLATSLDVMSASTGLSAARINGVIDNLQYQLAVLALNKSVGEYHPLAGR